MDEAGCRYASRLLLLARVAMTTGHVSTQHALKSSDRIPVDAACVGICFQADDKGRSEPETANGVVSEKCVSALAASLYFIRKSGLRGGGRPGRRGEAGNLGS